MNPTEKVYKSINILLDSIRVIISSKFFIKCPKKSGTLEILANGPSMRDKFSSILASKHEKMVVNYFANTEHYEAIKPKYYILAAPEFWMDEFQIGPNSDKRKQLYENIASKTRWKITFFIGIESRKSSFKNYLESLNDQIKVIEINLTPIDSENTFGIKLMNMKLGMPRPHNVLIPSLMVAIWLSYSNINIYGADHSWLSELSVDRENRTLLNQKHFYDYGNSKATQMKNIDKGNRKLHEVLHKFYLSFKAYHFIEKYAKANNSKILNVGQNSFIDAFAKQ